MSRGRAAALCAIALAATWAAGGAKPGSGASRGANLRPRRIFLGNVGLNDARPMADGNSRRLRGRLRGGYARAQCEASPRLLCEGRHYGQAGREDWPAPGFEDWYNVGILCVNFSATLKDVGGTSLALNVGHQDILRGNGWLVLDGTPLYGSREICFDAARATWTGLPAGTSLELIYINQSADAGRFPATRNGGSEEQIEQDERGPVLYARSLGLRIDTDLDAFLIRKENRAKVTPGNLHGNNGAPLPPAPNRGVVYAAGLRGCPPHAALGRTHRGCIRVGPAQWA